MTANPDAHTERKAYLVSGRVQGVGFRWWTRSLAHELGVGGIVRNLSDGTVRVDAEGTPQALLDLERSLHNGPPAAKVDKVEEIEPTSDPLPIDFTVGH